MMVPTAAPMDATVPPNLQDFVRHHGLWFLPKVVSRPPMDADWLGVAESIAVQIIKKQKSGRLLLFSSPVPRHGALRQYHLLLFHLVTFELEDFEDFWKDAMLLQQPTVRFHVNGRVPSHTPFAEVVLHLVDYSARGATLPMPMVSRLASFFGTLSKKYYPPHLPRPAHPALAPPATVTFAVPETTAPPTAPAVEAPPAEAFWRRCWRPRRVVAPRRAPTTTLASSAPSVPTNMFPLGTPLGSNLCAVETDPKTDEPQLTPFDKRMWHIIRDLASGMLKSGSDAHSRSVLQHDLGRTRDGNCLVYYAYGVDLVCLEQMRTFALLNPTAVRHVSVDATSKCFMVIWSAEDAEPDLDEKGESKEADPFWIPTTPGPAAWELLSHFSWTPDIPLQFPPHPVAPSKEPDPSSDAFFQFFTGAPAPPRQSTAALMAESLAPSVPENKPRSISAIVVPPVPPLTSEPVQALVSGEVRAIVEPVAAKSRSRSVLVSESSDDEDRETDRRLHDRQERRSRKRKTTSASQKEPEAQDRRVKTRSGTKDRAHVLPAKGSLDRSRGRAVVAPVAAAPEKRVKDKSLGLWSQAKSRHS